MELATLKYFKLHLNSLLAIIRLNNEVTYFVKISIQRFVELNPNDSWEKNIGRTYWMFQAKKILSVSKVVLFVNETNSLDENLHVNLDFGHAFTCKIVMFEIFYSYVAIAFIFSSVEKFRTLEIDM